MQRAFVFVSIATAVFLSASAEINLPDAVFRSVTDAPRIKIISDDELELTTERDGPHFVCKYSYDGDSLRVVATVFGSPQSIYFKFIPEGLQREDGTILYNASHFEAAVRGAAAERERQLAATVTPASPIAQPSLAPVLSASAAKAVALQAPWPEYPYEARARHITGSGVAILKVDSTTGYVTEASMAESIGNPMLDNSAISAFRRWRFVPGTVCETRIPITFTMSGASY